MLFSTGLYAATPHTSYMPYHLAPKTDSTYNLGNSSYRWLTLNCIDIISSATFSLADAASIYWTDGAETDSASVTHDGTNLVFWGDAATSYLELDGIGLKLDSGGLITNTHDDTTTITETVIKGAGKLVVTGEIVGGGTITLDGKVNNGISFEGTYRDHAIDIQPDSTFGENKAIYIGSWGTEAEMDDGGGLFRIYGKVGAGGTATANIFVRTLTESTTPPISAQFYSDCDAADSASAPNVMDGVDVFALINDNKYFAAPANDSLDMLESMRAIWAKVDAATGSHIYGNVATLWVDNQIKCSVTGREYAIFSTTGGSKPDAWAGFETTSSGWSYLFDFDKTSYDQDPVASGNATSGNKDYYLKVNINGSAYAIQLYAL